MKTERNLKIEVERFLALDQTKLSGGWRGGRKMVCSVLSWRENVIVPAK